MQKIVILEQVWDEVSQGFFEPGFTGELVEESENSANVILNGQSLHIARDRYQIVPGDPIGN